ncbi:MAG: tetratricopeptide repeat protein [Planctomycetaceae bacterium]
MTTHSSHAPILIVALLCGGLTGCAWFDALTADRRGEAQRLADSARLAEMEGNSRRAESLLAQAAEIRPNDAELHRHLARLAWEREDFTAAAEHYRRVVELASDDVEAWRRLGEARAGLGDDDGAREAARQALNCDPRDFRAILLQSRLADQRGDDADALEACHRALRGDPENVEARLRLAEIHLRESRSDRAAPLLRAICDDPDVDPESRGRAAWGLGIAYGRQHRWRDSALALEQALDGRSRTTADQWYQLAYAQLQAGRAAAAAASLDEAIRRDPVHRDARALHAALESGNPGAGRPGTIAAAGHTEPPAIAPPAGW